MKGLDWVGSTRQRLRRFPKEAKKEAGQQLRRIQQGLHPTSWRTMPEVGLSVMEIRLHKPHQHRIFYVASFPEAIYVLHAFEKKTRATNKLDIETGRKNYGCIKEQRKKPSKTKD